MGLERDNNDSDNSNDDRDDSFRIYNDGDGDDEDEDNDQKGDEYITEVQVVPEVFELKKRSSSIMERENDSDHDVNMRKKDLYQTLPQIPRALSSSSSDYIPSQSTYQLPTSAKQSVFSKQDVDITIDNPNDLGKISMLQARYDEAQEQRQPKHEDLSDMYLEHSNRQAKKQEKRERDKITRRKDINL